MPIGIVEGATVNANNVWPSIEGEEQLRPAFIAEIYVNLLTASA